jgi:hypothetical protein
MHMLVSPLSFILLTLVDADFGAKEGELFKIRLKPKPSPQQVKDGTFFSGKFESSDSVDSASATIATPPQTPPSEECGSPVTLSGVKELLVSGIGDRINAACQITIKPPPREALNETGALLDTFLAVHPWWKATAEPITEDLEFKPYQLTRHPPMMTKHLYALARAQFPEDCSQHPMWIEQNEGSFWGSAVVLFQMYFDEAAAKGAIYMPFGGNEEVGWPMYIEQEARKRLCPAARNGFDCYFLKNTFCPIPAAATFARNAPSHHRFSAKGGELSDEQWNQVPRLKTSVTTEIRSSFEHSMENRKGESEQDFREALIQQ